MKQRLPCFHSVFLWFQLNSGQFSPFRSYVYFSRLLFVLGRDKNCIGLKFSRNHPRPFLPDRIQDEVETRFRYKVNSSLHGRKTYHSFNRESRVGVQASSYLFLRE